MLKIRALTAGYGRNEVLHGLDLDVADASIVALIGANGAGKSTLLQTISGIHRVQSGTICYQDAEITGTKAHARIAAGLVHAPEGRRIFTNLSVAENLRMGAYLFRDDQVADDLARVIGIFPILGEFYRRPAASLSGGQQQMLAIARAIMGRPKLLLLDEPSLGLAPILVAQVMEAVSQLRDRGMAVLLVEQNAMAALNIADRAYVLETGRIVLSGPAQELSQSEAVREAYLGIS